MLSQLDELISDISDKCIKDETRDSSLSAIKQAFLEGYTKLLQLDASSTDSIHSTVAHSSQNMYDQEAAGPRILAEELVDMEEVGKGTFGMVFKSSWNATVVAKKVINKTRKNLIHSYGSAGPSDVVGVTQEDANNEVQALR